LFQSQRVNIDTALDWLGSHKTEIAVGTVVIVAGVTFGELVSIAGQGFQVIQLPKGLKFLQTPLPKELGPPLSE
jgi:hypothetical protein